MPLLVAQKNEKGGIEVVNAPDKAIKPEFKAYVDKRRAARAGTFAYKHRLALMKCSAISEAHMQGFFVQMGVDGLSESTVQKEIALLKAFYNSGKAMNWRGLANPCIELKLGKSQRRFVHLTKDQKAGLMAALHACDNPYFLPLVLTAKETTLRLSTLLNMTWRNTSVEDRNCYLPTKTGDKPYVLSKQVQEILGGLPSSPEGKVFPMSKSAVNSMWDRVRENCNLPKLQFRDLRHLGATDWVRRGLSAHELKNVLGHSGLATALFYVDLVGKDLEEALDKASENAGVMVLPPEFPKDPQAHLNARRAARLNKQPIPQSAPTVCSDTALPIAPSAPSVSAPIVADFQPVQVISAPTVVELTPESALEASIQAFMANLSMQANANAQVQVETVKQAATGMAAQVIPFDVFRQKAA
jgi:site-specific recombinase XerD